jgi:hypothetical protein
MLDDDILGFYDGWVDDLVAPLYTGKASIVSARLVTRDGRVAPCQGDTGDYTSSFFTAMDQRVPSAAIAFFNDGTIFDENYKGAGYEDTAYCRTMQQRYPHKNIVINNKCRLIHLNESKHNGANEKNKGYFLERWTYGLSVDTLIFSKNRPMQLDLLLQSIRDYYPVANSGINVLYKSTNAEYQKGYDVISKKYRNVNMLSESDFQKDTEAIVDSFSERYCQFFADDEVFVNKPDMHALLNAFTDDVACVSLRLGKSVTYCQPAKQAMEVPQFLTDGNILKWNWTTGYQFVDWYYPRSIIGTVHRTSGIKECLKKSGRTYRNPNEMELAIGGIADNARPHMVAMPYSCIVSIPENIISNLTNTPNMGIDPLEMTKQYNAGYRIHEGELYGMKNNNSCFPEIAYVIHRPRIGVFFERTGKMNGCQKVALNTIAGLQKLGIPYSENKVEKYNGALHMVKNVRELPKNTVIGVESFVLPEEGLDMWRLYQNWVTPCEWVTRSYRMSPCAANARIVEWPAAVETDRFNDEGRSPEYDCLVFYKNVTRQTSLEKLALVENELKARKLTYKTLTYGTYQEAELIAATKQARFAIWLAGTESENIALLEVLSSGVPTYVVDETTFKYSHFTMQGATSAPYFSDACGVKYTDTGRLDMFIDRLKEYRPRDYVLENFTLEKCAFAYYQLLISAMEY